MTKRWGILLASDNRLVMALLTSKNECRKQNLFAILSGITEPTNFAPTIM